MKQHWSEKYMKRWIDDAIRHQEKLQVRIDKIRKIIDMRNKNKMTLQQIGNELGHSKEYIRQVLSKFKL